MGRDQRNPVLEVSNEVRLNPASLASERDWLE